MLLREMRGPVEDDIIEVLLAGMLSRISVCRSGANGLKKAVGDACVEISQKWGGRLGQNRPIRGGCLFQHLSLAYFETSVMVREKLLRRTAATVGWPATFRNSGSSTAHNLPHHLSGICPPLSRDKARG